MRKHGNNEERTRAHSFIKILTKGEQQNHIGKKAVWLSQSRKLLGRHAVILGMIHCF